MAPLSAHRKQGGMRASEVGCVTIATSWVTGRTVPLWSRRRVSAADAANELWGLCAFLVTGEKKTPPWLWAKRCSIPRPGWMVMEKGRGKWWSWRLYFCFNRCCPICLYFESFINEALVIYSFHILWKYQQHFSSFPFLVATSVLVFFVSPFILSIFVIWSNTVALCYFLECLLKYIMDTILH